MGDESVAIISDELWHRDFGDDYRIVGRIILLNTGLDLSEAARGLVRRSRRSELESNRQGKVAPLCNPISKVRSRVAAASALAVQ